MSDVVAGAAGTAGAAGAQAGGAIEAQATGPQEAGGGAGLGASSSGGVFPDLGWVRDILRCPVTGAELVDGFGPDGAPELQSVDPVRPLAYPVRDGIPVLVESEARAL